MPGSRSLALAALVGLVFARRRLPAALSRCGTSKPPRWLVPFTALPAKVSQSLRPPDAKPRWNHCRALRGRPVRPRFRVARQAGRLFLKSVVADRRCCMPSPSSTSPCSSSSRFCVECACEMPAKQSACSSSLTELLLAPSVGPPAWRTRASDTEQLLDVVPHLVGYQRHACAKSPGAPKRRASSS